MKHEALFSSKDKKKKKKENNKVSSAANFVWVKSIFLWSLALLEVVAWQMVNNITKCNAI